MSWFLLVMILSCRDSGNRQTAFDRKVKCAREGREWFARVSESQRRYNETLINPQFAYNAELTTCLCYYRLNHGPEHSLVVTDISTDKEVLVWRDDLGGIDARRSGARRLTLEEFDHRISDLGFQP